MPATNELLASLSVAYPALSFVDGTDFQWSPKDHIVTFDPNDSYAAERLLHEVSHAELGHHAYTRDIELIAMERDAWQFAKITLGPSLGITVSPDVIEADMDTYRDWLHARSTCPKCKATGLQTSDDAYTCIACHANWRVNHAIGCALRRYIQKHAS